MRCFQQKRGGRFERAVWDGLWFAESSGAFTTPQQPSTRPGCERSLLPELHPCTTHAACSEKRVNVCARAFYYFLPTPDSMTLQGSNKSQSGEEKEKENENEKEKGKERKGKERKGRDKERKKEKKKERKKGEEEEEEEGKNGKKKVKRKRRKIELMRSCLQITTWLLRVAPAFTVLSHFTVVPMQCSSSQAKSKTSKTSKNRQNKRELGTKLIV